MTILLGKDYLTPLEAAEYACVPLPVFEQFAQQHGILPFPWMGQTVYRKADIQMAMERAWRLSTSEGAAGISNGRKRENSSGAVSVPLPKPTRKRAGSRSKDAS
jgi:hypothetical protein